ncbi:MAG TPA: hypothetical protein PL029_02810 [Bacteroidia bacterium]|nr:hypothetical protein [Bacteroidia bacterium]
MKKDLLIRPAIVFLFSLLLFACQKKGDHGILRPGFKSENGTGGNPIKGPTGTGSTANTNPATQNSSLLTGGVGWSNPSCASTLSVTLKGVNGIIDITLSFLTPPVTGTYAIATAPSSQACAMVVNNAPNQPAGTVWYGKTGVVSVTATNNNITATFSGIICTQNDFAYPQVTVSGSLGCN